MYTSPASNIRIRRIINIKIVPISWRTLVNDYVKRTISRKGALWCEQEMF